MPSHKVKREKNLKDKTVKRFLNDNIDLWAPMADGKCCPIVKKPRCCMKYAKDITESRGFQNLVKCIMKQTGACKCDAIMQAKCAYKNFREFEKCKYRYMRCKCPEPEPCAPGPPAIIVCTKKPKPPCVKCPCDKPRPCPCKTKPANPCARGRMEAAVADSSPEPLDEIACGPHICFDCGGAYLENEAMDGLGYGDVDGSDDDGLHQNDMAQIAKSIGFKNFLKMFETKDLAKTYSRHATKAKGLVAYRRLNDKLKTAFRRLGLNPKVCYNPSLRPQF